MTKLNTDTLNRTIFISDNLPFLRSLDSESVDLVVIDPPFGKNQTFEGELKPQLTDEELAIELELLADWGIQNEADAYDNGVEWIDQKGQTAMFRDIWDFRFQVTKDEWDRLGEVVPGAQKLIELIRQIHSDSQAAYVSFMAMRLVELHRVLKPTGSIYLHCDDGANSHLRMLMDAVFGHRNFCNEIVWQRNDGRGKGSQHAPRRWGRNTDHLLFYVKGGGVPS